MAENLSQENLSLDCRKNESQHFFDFENHLENSQPWPPSLYPHRAGYGWIYNGRAAYSHPRKKCMRGHS